MKDASLDGDLEWVLPLLAVFFLASAVLACFYFIYGAPLLFAELILDGALSATLYRRLRLLDARHWLETALRHTFKPFLATALGMVVLGVAMALYASGARSVGEVLGRLLS